MNHSLFTAKILVSRMKHSGEQSVAWQKHLSVRNIMCFIEYDKNTVIIIIQDVFRTVLFHYDDEQRLQPSNHKSIKPRHLSDPE